MKRTDEEIVGDILKVRMKQKYLTKFSDVNHIEMYDRKGNLKMSFTKDKGEDKQ